MFWGKKESSQLPDLPPMKSGLQGRTTISPPRVGIEQEHEDDSEDFSPVERHGLPSFPDSPLSKGFSQSAIKDAVINDSVKDGELVGFSQEPKSFKVVEVDDETLSTSSMSVSSPLRSVLSRPEPLALPVATVSAMTSPVASSVPVVPYSVPVVPYSPMPSRGGDVFVKIDRFNSARKALNTVSTQLEGVDSLLKKIRETKMREEQEFSAWEKDMALAKSKIEEITKAIFEKTD